MARAIDPETLRPFESSKRERYEGQWRGQPFTIGLPSERLRGDSSVADLGLFLSIGEAWAQLALAFAPNRPLRVLDIGCGCGKMARFLYLNPQLEYIGLDPHPAAIEWCREAFAKAGTRFQFRHLDVYAPSYNETGKLDPDTVSLPIDDASIDLVIAGSLFTHLREAAFKRYMQEIRRCLKSDGRAIVSIHTQPIRGRFWDDIERIDIAADYFVEIVAASGLQVVEPVGNMFGQQVYVLGPA
jgi:SAM-dependent methyltransferase